LITRDTVVLGTSSGGVDALCEIVSALPANFPAVVLVALHVGMHRSILPEMLSRSGPLQACHARDGEPLKLSTIYIAPPDHHLLVVHGHARLSTGPKENFARPAIDPLFRSAAISRGSRVIGVILTGRLDDGAAGLQAVRACSGVTITQDPSNAYARDMPENAMRATSPDYVLRLDQIGPKLVALAGTRAPNPGQGPPPTLVAENDMVLAIAERNAVSSVATPSTFTCPECNQALWQINGSMPPRFRCSSGHAYSTGSLSAASDGTVVNSLAEALRALHKKTALSKLRAAYHMRLGESENARRYVRDARRASTSAHILEGLLHNDD
jgi:two-component system chemotaxis response regulator CheB